MEVDQAFLASATSVFAREIHCALVTCVPSLKSMAAPLFEYGAENEASFEKHIYPIFNNAANRDTEERMSKKDAMAIIFPEGAESGLDPSAIKKQYRKMSQANHPDRLATGEVSSDEAGAMEIRFRNIQSAYIALGTESAMSGLSWYEGIGGKGRDGFSGALTMSTSAIGAEAPAALLGHTEKGGYSQALQALASDVSKFFASRNAHGAATSV
jgi:hypothetical protein